MIPLILPLNCFWRIYIVQRFPFVSASIFILWRCISFCYNNSLYKSEISASSSKLLAVCSELEKKTPIPPLLKLLILMLKDKEGDTSQDFLDLLRTVPENEVDMKMFFLLWHSQISTEKIGHLTLLQHSAREGKESHIQALLDHG